MFDKCITLGKKTLTVNSFITFYTQITVSLNHGRGELYAPTRPSYKDKVNRAILPLVLFIIN